MPETREIHMPASTATPDLITSRQSVEEEFLRHILARDQMKEFTKRPLVM